MCGTEARLGRPGQRGQAAAVALRTDLGGELFGDQRVVAGFGAFPSGVQGVSQVGVQGAFGAHEVGVVVIERCGEVVDGFGFAQQRQAVASPPGQDG